MEISATQIAVFAMVLVVLGIMFVEVGQGFEQAKAWCHSYNGTIVSEGDLLHCKFPNGTTKPLP